MENNLPSEEYRPEDEYPELETQPAAQADVTEELPESEAPSEEAPAEAQTADIPTPDEPKTSPAEQTADPSAPPVQQAFPQGGIPYMTYPLFPPMPGVGMPYPMNPEQQQQSGQQQYPPQGLYYIPYFAPYPPQQAQGFVPPAAPQNPAAPVAPVVVPDAVPEDRKPSSTGTKAFLIVLAGLMLAMVVAFTAIVINGFRNSASNSDNSKDTPSLTQKNDSFDRLPDNNKLPDSDSLPEPIYGDEDNKGGKEVEHSDIEDEITLVADDGATQKRDTDNPDSIGKPDKNAKGIELTDAPKDADDTSKYTAKSSFDALTDSVVTVTCYEDEVTENIFDVVSGGSGTIISSDGYIVTNAHVLGNSKQYVVNVTLNNGKKHLAKIIGYDTWTDLALLKIDAKNLKPAVFGDSEKAKVGDDIITIGSDEGANYDNSMTQGTISAIDKEVSTGNCVRYILSDTAISTDESGGPLCNLCGQVIGVTTAKTTANNCSSIPSSIVKDIVEDLLHYGYVPDRPRIGFTGSEVPSEYTNYYGIPHGVVVSEIADDGALKGSKVEPGDVITAIDGKNIESFQDIYNILSEHKSGDKVKLSIYRVDDKSIFIPEEKEEK